MQDVRKLVSDTLLDLDLLVIDWIKKWRESFVFSNQLYIVFVATPTFLR